MFALVCLKFHQVGVAVVVVLAVVVAVVVALAVVACGQRILYKILGLSVLKFFPQNSHT